MENEFNNAAPTHATTGLTHFDESGRPQMVDVSDKADSRREAVAQAVVVMEENTRVQIEQRTVHKGDVLAIAELAGIMGAKRTSELIPLCHPVPLTKVNVVCTWDRGNDSQNPPGQASLIITASVLTTYRTGVEMEALTACSTAALTVYDMCKAVDRGMAIQDIRLLYKAGGKSGTFDRR
ncbi:cyclic pyranopterin monophosphate synthase MoaC [Alicyclobacillus tolerans]|uniref:cyclic pyranopterin monophosphate synthase MoaC n=1 Tax=Alicyclobacillus tolerans TaxID=90970 RepID=UPI001F032AD0|nr:cyclic pyranopterin monophosphate synthase MoaC [Alicyclobacillus tolerans]MCF8563651.1 cyclic pyranopterin monophosphate synthase MoaC [Alicyclobacillus tolerans]